MKIKQKDYDALTKLITDEVKSHSKNEKAALLKKYRDAGKSEKSYVWGVIWSTPRKERTAFFDSAYEYSKDNDVFVAAKKILKEIGVEY